jgi:EAL domain-containing protein (putative c-di-GMP-specific phosphodiesterase class I)
MGKKLGLSIVSEGVETQQDYELLKKLGSDIAQGYLFSRPLPACFRTSCCGKPTATVSWSARIMK